MRGRMTSARRLYANRLNARASTGPRTAEGKARAAQNARRHGLPLPALSDPAMTKEIGRLGREFAGARAGRERFEAACRIVAAQIDLLRIRQARLPLLSRILVDPTAIKRLHSIDRYERYARSLRKFAISQFGSARPPAAANSGPTIWSTDADGIDIAAVLQKLPVRKTRRSSALRVGTRRARSKVHLSPVRSGI
jgi:hypothetical protein